MRERALSVDRAVVTGLVVPIEVIVKLLNVKTSALVRGVSVTFYACCGRAGRQRRKVIGKYTSRSHSVD